MAAKTMGVTPDERQRRMVGYGHYDLVVAVLERALAGREWIAGGRFSAADVYFGSQIAWGVTFGTLPDRDVFTAYVARLTARAAHRRAAALDDAATPAAA